MFEDTNIDITFWIKFAICMGIVVILPVWILNFVEITILWKLSFTAAGAAGVFMALTGKSMRKRR